MPRPPSPTSSLPKIKIGIKSMLLKRLQGTGAQMVAVCGSNYDMSEMELWPSAVLTRTSWFRQSPFLFYSYASDVRSWFHNRLICLAIGRESASPNLRRMSHDSSELKATSFLFAGDWFKERKWPHSNQSDIRSLPKSSAKDLALRVRYRGNVSRLAGMLPFPPISGVGWYLKLQ